MSEPALPVLLAPRVANELDRLKRLVLVGIASPDTRRAYEQALDDFLGWYQAEPRDPFFQVDCRGIPHLAHRPPTGCLHH